jgi:hypothetical protein
MLATNIPYLHCRNGIFYYRNQSVWKSYRTRCKKDAFRKLSFTLFGTTSALNDTKLTVNDTSATPPDSKLTAYDPVVTLPSTSELIKAYLSEYGNRWCDREYTRIESSVAFLPVCVIIRQIATELKASILAFKTVTTFNRYLKYFNAFFRWVLAPIMP